MMKKLMVFSLTLFFLLGSSALNSAGNPVQVDKAKKPAFVTNQGSNSIVKKRVRNPHMEALDSKRSVINKNMISIPVENVMNSVQDLEGDVIPVQVKKANKPDKIRKHGYLYPGRSEIEPIDSRGVHGWLFNYDDDGWEYYLSGGTAGDEWGIWFQSPQAACSLYAVEFQFYDGVGGGTIELDVMAAGAVLPDTVPNADSIAVDSIFGDNLMGVDETFPLEIQALSDWERFVFPDWGYEMDAGRDIFWIHWTKTGDSPMLLADADNASNYLRTWDYEPNQDGDWKWSHYGSSVGIEAAVRVEVVFYEDPPPNVTAIQTNDTYSPDAITVTASASDNALDPDLEGIASGNLVYSVNGSDWDTLAATVTGDTAVGFTLTATIPAGDIGDEVEYYFEAWDLADLYARSFPSLFFHRTEPANPDADILIVRDNVSTRQSPLFEQVLDDMNFVYELWDTGDRNGIDASVISQGWTNIFVYGWGNKTVPVVAGEDDPGYGDFIDGGGNLFLVDMDWFFGHNLDASLTFVAGDFAYDYFGLATGENDPGPIDVVLVTGLGVTDIDIPFTTDPLTLNHAIYLDDTDLGWIDYITTTDGTDIFQDDAGNIVGAALDHSGTGGGKAVYLSFMADAAGDTLDDGSWDYSQFAALLEGAIAYFDAVSPPSADLIGEGSTRYGVASGTNTATINAVALDGDGTLTNVVAKWVIDDGAENSETMDLVGVDEYSTTIGLTGFVDTSTVVYWVEATDNDGLTTLTDPLSFWGTDFVPSGAPALYMQDHFAPYDVYGPAVADSMVMANMVSAGINFDKWVVWDDYQADYATVLSHYDAVIYAGVYDWVMNPVEANDHTLTEFVDNGGYLFYSSEEALGMYSDYEDISFSPGHFVHDVLGVEWVGNDYNYAGVYAWDSDSGLVDGFDTSMIELDTTLDYFGSMADLCDPLGYGTDDQLPSPFVAASPIYYNSVVNGNVVFMAFNISMMPDDRQVILLDNFRDWAGIPPVAVDDEIVSLPGAFALHQNYPNPFNPVTNLQFDLPEGADVKLVIYNLLGQKVTSLMNRELKAGYHNVIWNGRDQFGRPVGSGVYIYRLTAGDFTSSKKMLLLK